jgi:hypothetical protein
MVAMAVVTSMAPALCPPATSMLAATMTLTTMVVVVTRMAPVTTVAVITWGTLGMLQAGEGADHHLG